MFVQIIFHVVFQGTLGRSKVRAGALHSIVELPVLQGLPLLLRFVLQVIPLFQVAQHQTVEDVLVGLLEQLLKEPQRHDADLDTRGDDVQLSIYKED